MKVLLAERPLGLVPARVRSRGHSRNTPVVVSSRFVRAPGRRARTRPKRLRSTTSTSIVAASTPSDDGSATAPTPLSLALELRGTWIADYGRSSGRAKLLSALGLSGLSRVTAEKLIEGVELRVVDGNLVAAFLTVVPFFDVREAVPLDGSPVRLPRRDLKPGDASVSLRVERRQKGGAPAPLHLVVVSEWLGDAKKGLFGVGGTSAAPTLSLREEYRMIKPTELHVEASLFEGGGSAAVASSVTVYRLSGGWKPKYEFPSSGSPSPPPSSSRLRVSSSPPPAFSRRSVALSSFAAAAFLAPRPADAALPPGLVSPSPSSSSSSTPSPIPKASPLPPTFPRKRLALPLAVLLLRSCYDALDEADVVAMDGFQRDFFKIRASAWEPYLELLKKAASRANKRYERPTQGELSDPAYFDVIAFSQAATIDEEFRKTEERAFIARAEATSSSSPSGSSPSGSSSRPVFEFTPTFEEFCEAGVERDCPESGLRGVARSTPLVLPGIGNDDDDIDGDVVSALWARQRASAGDLMYSRMASGPFRGLDFSPPPPPRAFDAGEVAEAAEALARVFVDNGFALGKAVSCVPSSEDPSSLVVTLRLDGPADLWTTSTLLESAAASSSSYGARRAPAPAFAGLALGGLLRASEALSVGDEPSAVRVVGGGTATEVSWRVEKKA